MSPSTLQPRERIAKAKSRRRAHLAIVALLSLLLAQAVEKLTATYISPLEEQFWVSYGDFAGFVFYDVRNILSSPVVPAVLFAFFSSIYSHPNFLPRVTQRALESVNARISRFVATSTFLWMLGIFLAASALEVGTKIGESQQLIVKNGVWEAFFWFGDPIDFSQAVGPKHPRLILNNLLAANLCALALFLLIALVCGKNTVRFSRWWITRQSAYILLCFSAFTILVATLRIEYWERIGHYAPFFDKGNQPWAWTVCATFAATSFLVYITSYRLTPARDGKHAPIK